MRRIKDWDVIIIVLLLKELILIFRFIIIKEYFRVVVLVFVGFNRYDEEVYLISLFS